MRRLVAALAALVVSVTLAPVEAQSEAEVSVLDHPVLASGTVVSLVPDDPLFAQQENLVALRASDAWNTTLGSTDAAVCVLDTGVRHTHEDLAGARWGGGYDFVNGDADPMDDYGHGTMMAGIAAASIGNAVGIAGVANVAVFGVKVLDASGGGSFANVVSGFSWCIQHTPPRTVIVAAIGATTDNADLRNVIQAAVASGRLVVAAVGSGVSYPASYPEVIAAGCATSQGNACATSPPPGTTPAEVAAPTTMILGPWSSSDSAYRISNGTSWAAAQVAGALALYWSHDASIDGASLRARLSATARDIGEPGYDERAGCGLVDLALLMTAPPNAAGCGSVLPGAPRDLAAATAEAPGSIVTSWQAPLLDGGAPLEGYRVYVAPSCAGPFALLAQVDASTLSYAQTGLPAGATRCYRATSHNSLGESAPSNAASARTLVPPAKPVRVAAAPGAQLGEIEVTWAVSAGTPPASKFRVERATWGESEFVAAGEVGEAARSFTDAGLTPLRTYVYRVVATNAAGESAPSALACAKPSPWVALGPTGVTPLDALDLACRAP